MNRDILSVKVWGPWACFTRPEMKVERVSYDVMTPSAARGVLEAIFWKPEFFWEVRAIEVLRPVRHFSIMRNEVKRVATARSAFDTPYYADEDRTQRHTLALRDVCYIIHADVRVLRGKDEHPEKYRAQFRRRVEKGRCFHQPYLGCREFSAYFSPPEGDETPIDRTTDLGRMVFDFPYSESGRESAILFEAKLNKGVMSVPPEKYQKVEVNTC